MSIYVSDEQARAAVEALREAGGNKAHAARLLELPRTTLLSRLAIAARRNLDGHAPGPEMPQGFHITRVTELLGPDGSSRGAWVQRKPEAVSREMIVDALKEAFEAYEGLAVPAPMPSVTEPDLATIYMLADHHLGMYSWAKETGDNYDLALGEQLLKDAMAQLVDRAPPSAVGVVLNLGDFFHSDNSLNRTQQNGNALDVDSRYPKVLVTGVNLMLFTIEQAKQKHERVIVRCLPGNHDPHAAQALSVALYAFYASDPRVEVDLDPGLFFWWTFGKNFVAATHGHETKPENLPGVMAAYKPQEWGAAEFRYAYLGHVHHRSRGGGEHHGVVWETFQTLAPKDAWHRGQGYSSGRSMTAITLDAEWGEVMRHTVSVKTK